MKKFHRALPLIFTYSKKNFNIFLDTFHKWNIIRGNKGLKHGNYF